MGLEKFRRFVPLELQGQLETRFHQAIGEIGGGGREVLLQDARDALPFGGLKRRREGLDAHLQSAARLDGHKTALQVHLARLHAAQQVSAACSGRNVW